MADQEMITMLSQSIQKRATQNLAGVLKELQKSEHILGAGLGIQQKNIAGLQLELKKLENHLGGWNGELIQ